MQFQYAIRLINGIFQCRYIIIRRHNDGDDIECSYDSKKYVSSGYGSTLYFFLHRVLAISTISPFMRVVQYILYRMMICV